MVDDEPVPKEAVIRGSAWQRMPGLCLTPVDREDVSSQGAFRTVAIPMSPSG